MVNLGQAAAGIVVLLVVIGGLLYIFYSRTNAVEKTGYGALTMLALVSLMIPIFWIAEGGNQAAAQAKQQTDALVRGQRLYAQNCRDRCFGIDAKSNKVINPTYNGYAMADYKALTDNDVIRIVSAGIFNPKSPIQPLNMNAVPRSEELGGGLSSNDVSDLVTLIRSADPKYLQNHNLPKVNGFDSLPDYLQHNDPSLYSAAVSFAQTGQFGQPVDKTADKAVTIDIVNPGQEGTSCSSQTACYSPINIKVKVGTVITWVNKSNTGHTITAINGTDTASPKAAPQIFDSANGSTSNLVPTGSSYKYTVTAEAFKFDPTNHRVIYYCRIHPDMLAQLTIVQ